MKPVIFPILLKEVCAVKSIGWGRGACRKFRGLGRKTKDSFSCDRWESDNLFNGFKGLYTELVIPSCAGVKNLWRLPPLSHTPS